MGTKLRGVIHGKIIELEHDLGIPEGQQVIVQVESLEAAGNWIDRIVVDPAILSGQPVIKGTQILAEELVNLLSQGRTEDELRRKFPNLTAADVEAVSQFASVPAGLRHSFGGWAEDAEGLDDFLEWNRHQRQQERIEVGGCVS